MVPEGIQQQPYVYVGEASSKGYLGEEFPLENMPNQNIVDKEVKDKRDKQFDIGPFFKKLVYGTGIAIGGLGSVITAPAWLLSAGMGLLVGSQIKIPNPEYNPLTGEPQTDRRGLGAIAGSGIGSHGFTFLLLSCFHALAELKRGESKSQTGV